MSYKPPRIILTGMHLGWVMHRPQVRTPSQSNWLETTWNLIPPPQNPGWWAMRQSISPRFLTLLLSAQASFPIKSLALSVCRSPQTVHFLVSDKSPLSGPGGSPLSCNTSIHSSTHPPIYPSTFLAKELVLQEQDLPLLVPAQNKIWKQFLLQDLKSLKEWIIPKP